VPLSSNPHSNATRTHGGIKRSAASPAKMQTACKHKINTRSSKRRAQRAAVVDPTALRASANSLVVVVVIVHVVVVVLVVVRG
jgi:hypothetical protein